MQRCNRSKFASLKQQYELMKMKSAYILAEQAIMKNPSLTSWDEIEIRHKDGSVEFHRTEAMDAAQFWTTDSEGELKPLTVKDMQLSKLEEELKQVEEVGRTLLAEEKYELLQEAKELYDKIKRQLDNLRGNAS